MESDKMKEKLTKHKPGKIVIPNKASSSGSQSGGHPDTDIRQSSSGNSDR